MHAQMKEIRRRIDEEEERIRKTRRRQKGHQVAWEGISSVGGTPYGGGNKDDPRQEDSSVREFRNQLGRSLFVGGIPHTVSSGILQEHSQPFARVKHCAMLTETRNDQSKTAKVTLETREDRHLAMVADDSSLGGESFGFALGHAGQRKGRRTNNSRGHPAGK